MVLTFGPLGPDNSITYGMVLVASSTVAVLAGDYWEFLIQDITSGQVYTAGEASRADPTPVLMGWSSVNHHFSGLYIPLTTAQMGRANTQWSAVLYRASGAVADSGAHTPVLWQPAGNPATLLSVAGSDLSTVLAAVRQNYANTP